MAIADEKIFKIITPKSEADPDYEAYEFMLTWIGRKGEPYQWLFEDWTESVQTETMPINEAEADTVRTLVEDETVNLTMVAENITPNELSVLRSIPVAKEAYRLFKDGTLEPLAIVSTSYTLDGQKQRYRFTITVQQKRRQLVR